MKKTLFIAFLLACFKLQAFSCFGNTAPKYLASNTQKEVLDTSISDSEDAFIEIGRVESGINPLDIAYTNNGKFAAVSNQNSNSVFVYQVDCETGLFSHIQTVDTTFSPKFISFSPCDATVAVSAFNSPSLSLIQVYSIDCATGKWALIQTIEFPETEGPFGLQYSPDGRFLAVVNVDGVSNAFITVYRVSQISGRIILSDKLNTPPGPTYLAFSPDGKFIAVSFTSGSIAVYEIDQVTGKLTEISGSPFTAGINPFRLAYQHDGRFLAVVNAQGSNVFVYSVNRITGTLDDALPQIITVPFSPLSVEFSINDTLAAVGGTIGSLAGAITVFRVSDGQWQTPAIQTIPNLAAVSDVAFSPCGDNAAASLTDPVDPLGAPGEIINFTVTD